MSPPGPTEHQKFIVRELKKKTGNFTCPPPDLLKPITTMDLESILSTVAQKEAEASIESEQTALEIAIKKTDEFMERTVKQRRLMACIPEETEQQKKLGKREGYKARYRQLEKAAKIRASQKGLNIMTMESSVKQEPTSTMGLTPFEDTVTSATSNQTESQLMTSRSDSMTSEPSVMQEQLLLLTVTLKMTPYEDIVTSPASIQTMDQLNQIKQAATIKASQKGLKIMTPELAMKQEQPFLPTRSQGLTPSDDIVTSVASIDSMGHLMTSRCNINALFDSCKVKQELAERHRRYTGWNTAPETAAEKSFSMGQRYKVHFKKIEALQRRKEMQVAAQRPIAVRQPRELNAGYNVSKRTRFL